MAETSQTGPATALRPLAKGVALAVVVMVVAECLRVFVGANFGCVAPGLCYRSSQPSPAFLANMKRTYGIRSVINLLHERKHRRRLVSRGETGDAGTRHTARRCGALE